jgi:ribonuclease P protein component
MIVKVRSTQLPQNRLMCVVSAKVNKRATIRNRLRRQVVAAAKNFWPQLSQGWDIAVIIRNGTQEPTTSDLQKELEHCLKRLGVLN